MMERKRIIMAVVASGVVLGAVLLMALGMTAGRDIERLTYAEVQSIRAGACDCEKIGSQCDGCVSQTCSSDDKGGSSKIDCYTGTQCVANGTKNCGEQGDGACSVLTTCTDAVCSQGCVTTQGAAKTKATTTTCST